MRARDETDARLARELLLLASELERQATAIDGKTTTVTSEASVAGLVGLLRNTEYFSKVRYSRP